MTTATDDRNNWTECRDPREPIRQWMESLLRQTLRQRKWTKPRIEYRIVNGELHFREKTN